jgi:adenylyltransferase/sulfurtransferase
LLKAANIKEIIEGYDFIIDGTDNFPAKFLINDACVMLNKAYSHGGVLRFEGQTMTYTPGNACYRCVFQEPPPKDTIPKCSQAGILGVVAGMLGTVQAAEAIKYILGIGNVLKNKLLIFDSLTMNYRTVNIKKDKNCFVCGEKPVITELID